MAIGRSWFLGLVLVAGCGGGGGGTGAGTPDVVPPPAVAFLGDEDSDGRNELYLAREGQEPVCLSGILGSGGGVGAFRWSHDRQRIAFSVYQDMIQNSELYVVGLDGAAPVLISGSGDPATFCWSPDDTRIAFSMKPDASTPIQLYTAKPDGSDLVRINPTELVDDVGMFGWAPDGSRIAYLAYQDYSAYYAVRLELYTARPDGTSNQRVNGFLAANDEITSLLWAPDSSKIAYTVHPANTSAYNLFVCLPEGSTTYGIGSGVDGDYQWAPDSSRIAYRSAAGLYCKKLGQSSVLVSTGGAVQSFGWAPDSSRLFYVAGQLYTTSPLDNLSVLAVNAPLPGGWSVNQAQWAPDGSRIGYTAGNSTSTKLFACSSSVPASGVEVSGATPPKAIPFFRWSPDGSRIAYLSVAAGSTIRELWLATAGMAFSGTPLSTAGVVGLSWTGDGAWIVYQVGEISYSPYSVTGRVCGIRSTGGAAVDLTEETTAQGFGPYFEPAN